MNLLKLTLDFNLTIPELKVEGKHDTTAVISDKIVAKLYGTDGFNMVLKSEKFFSSIFLFEFSFFLSFQI